MGSRYTTSGVRFASIAEVTEGVTPTTPAFAVTRFTSESLNQDSEYTRSKELDVNGNIQDDRLSASWSTNTVTFEFSDGAHEEWLERALRSTWSTNTLVNAKQLKPFTGETYYDSGSDLFKRGTGMFVNSLGMVIVPNDIVNCSMEMMGRNFEMASTAIAGATYVAAPTEPVMVGADFSTLSIGSLGVDCATRITMNIAGGLRRQQCLGDVAANGFGFGDLEVSGEIEAYLDSDYLTAIEVALAGTPDQSLSFTLGLVTGKKTTFSIPRIRLKKPVIETPSGNNDIMVKWEYMGLKDGANKTIQITRNVA